MYDFTFIIHLYEEMDFLNEMRDIYTGFRQYKIEYLIEYAINECTKQDKNNKENYKFINDNEKIYINKDEFWEEWNKNLEKILYEVSE